MCAFTSSPLPFVTTSDVFLISLLHKLRLSITSLIKRIYSCCREPKVEPLDKTPVTLFLCPLLVRVLQERPRLVIALSWCPGVESNGE
jgi:hypothetical protein